MSKLMVLYYEYSSPMSPGMVAIYWSGDNLTEAVTEYQKACALHGRHNCKLIACAVLRDGTEEDR